MNTVLINVNNKRKSEFFYTMILNNSTVKPTFEDKWEDMLTV